MKVLHTLEAYLHLTTNWIYPQIVAVPETETRVLCRRTDHPEAFPLPRSHLRVCPPPSRVAFGVPRFIDRVARRLGRADIIAEWRLRRWRPHLVHAHFGTHGWEMLPLCRRLRLPLATAFYGYDAWMMPVIDPGWHERYRELFSLGAIFLVEGGAMRRRLAALGCPDHKIRVHRIGVNLDALPFAHRSFRAPLNVVMIGRFVEKKGLVDGLTACALAGAAGARLRVTIIGDALSGDARGGAIKKELTALSRTPALDGRVRFTGFLTPEQTKAEMASQDIFLCPSRHSSDGDAEGGSPVVLTEAMAMGLCCIGTEHCDIPELIRDGATGRLCPERNVAALGDALRAAAAEPAALADITVAARTFVEQEFSLDRQLQRLGAIYRDVAATPSSPR